MTTAARHTQTGCVTHVAKIAAIVLAAGGSRRLGRPKQLVQIAGESLLRRAARAASDTSCAHVLCVLGDRSDEMVAELAGTRAVVVRNAAWERGIGTSIRAGVQAAEELGATAVLVMLCDQPFVDAALLTSLISSFEAGGVSPRSAVLGAACSYAGTVGVPALFGRSLLGSLRDLGDDEGARKILARVAGDLAVIDAPGAETDVDTEDDVAKL